MTVNELIFNFRINVESGGVFIIEKDTGSFLKVTKAMLDKIGDMEIKSHNIFDSKVMINIGMNVEELKTIAEDKHVSLSTLVMIALDNYLQNQRPAMVVDSFAEKVRIEIAKRQTKPAWVADQLNIPRSTFSSKLAANNFTREEQERITRYFGWRTEA